MTANLPLDVGDIVTADLLNEVSGISDSETFLLTSNLSPLTSSANTNATILSGSYTFTSGYAYEISIQCRFTVDITANAASTDVGRALFGLTRATAAGTGIYNSGYIGMPSDLTPQHFAGSQVVKCTAGDTTQTICFVGQYSSVLTAVALNITTNGAVTPARMTIQRIGLASNHSDALEVPTS